MDEEDSVSTSKMLSYQEIWRTKFIPNKVTGMIVKKRKGKSLKRGKFSY